MKMTIIDKNKDIGKFIQNLINTKNINHWIFLGQDNRGRKYAFGTNEDGGEIKRSILKGKFFK